MICKLLVLCHRFVFDRRVIARGALLMTCCGSSAWAGSDDLDARRAAAPDILLVVGAPGDPEYAEAFSEWADRWHEAASPTGAELAEIGRDAAGEATDRERLRERIAGAAAASSDRPLWLVLIGHGTYYQDVAKFNLRGPDVAAGELAQWLAPLERPTVVVNCSSSSGPFLDRLAAPNRVVITATRSGDEQNFARFGDYFSRAIADPAADLDHDQSVSALEAFLRASADVARFYREEGRLATEHALLDDNGDGRGTPAEFFRGVRAVGAPADQDAEVDGRTARGLILVPHADAPELTAEELALRDEIEAAIEELRSRKSDFTDDQYYTQLERLLLPLARLYARGESDDDVAPSDPDDADDPDVAED